MKSRGNLTCFFFRIILEVLNLEVISLTEGKVILKDDCVIKKSNQTEYMNLVQSATLVEKLPSLELDTEKRKIKTPKVYNFDHQVIRMERFYGTNVELGLRDLSTHKKYVEYLNFIFLYFLQNNFYWLDFAPRNILINEDSICLFDFERGFLAEQKSNLEYLRQPNVYEEYAAFLLPEERIYSIRDIFMSEDSHLINIEEIGSKRVKTILKLWNYIDFVPYSVYLKALQTIVEAEIPYFEGAEIRYPLVKLEEFINTHSHEEYAKLVLRRKRG